MARDLSRAWAALSEEWHSLKALNAESGLRSEGGAPISERAGLWAWRRGQLRYRTTRSEIGIPPFGLAASTLNLAPFRPNPVRPTCFD